MPKGDFALCVSIRITLFRENHPDCNDIDQRTAAQPCQLSAFVYTHNMDSGELFFVSIKRLLKECQFITIFASVSLDP